MKRGSVYGRFESGTLAWEAVWSRLFRKELPTDPPKIVRKSMNIVRNFTSERGIGHLVLQNQSQKVWERHGMVLDPKIPYQILKTHRFWVSGSAGGPGRSVALFCYDKESPILLSGSCLGSSAVFMEPGLRPWAFSRSKPAKNELVWFGWWPNHEETQIFKKCPGREQDWAWSKQGPSRAQTRPGPGPAQAGPGPGAGAVPGQGRARRKPHNCRQFFLLFLLQ